MPERVDSRRWRHVIGQAGWVLPTEPLILIGPARAGKSTVGQLLASALGRPFVDLDDVGEAFYDEVGQPLSAFVAEIADRGFAEAHRWWQPARAHAVARVLAEHAGAVIAFGAGHSHYEDRRFFDFVRDLMNTALVVLLLPDADEEVALHELRERCLVDKGDDWVRDGTDLLEVWVSSEQNRALADVVIYSTGEGPAEVKRSIVRWLIDRS